MAHNEQLDKIINEDGFIAALDQSGGSTPKALLQYDVDHSYYKMILKCMIKYILCVSE